jgi:hypothetical protein
LLVFVLSAVDVAETEMAPVAFVGAMKFADVLPVEDIEPVLADQETVESKFPVPWTTAVHWPEPPCGRVSGVQDALTEVIAGDVTTAGGVFPPPPQLMQVANISNVNVFNALDMDAPKC